jgi:hypothetical protein
VADQQTLGDVDPHEEIVCLEEHIEELAVKIESCRKFILASRIAIAGGGVVLAAMLLGAIRSDLGLIAASVASFLGGIVVWGSNSMNEMAAAESERARDLSEDIVAFSRKPFCRFSDIPIGQGKPYTINKAVIEVEWRRH